MSSSIPPKMGNINRNNRSVKNTNKITKCRTLKKRKVRHSPMKATVRRQITYPYNIDYICAAFPPRAGYLSVRKDKTNYELFGIPTGKKWELLYPPKDDDSWITMCKKQYVGPDLVMIDDHTFTTYIKLF